MNLLLKTTLLLCLSTTNIFSQEKPIYIEFPELFYKKAVIFSDSNRVSTRISGFAISDISLKYIEKAEKILLNEVEKSKEKSIERIISRKMYEFSHRQYVGYKNEKGKKIIMIRLIYFKKRKHKKITEFHLWNKAVVTGYGGFYEKYIKTYFINVDEKKFVRRNLRIFDVLIPWSSYPFK